MSAAKLSELASRLQTVAGLEVRPFTACYSYFQSKKEPREVIELNLEQAERVVALLEHLAHLRGESIDGESPR